MYQNPDLPDAPVKALFPDGAKELWLKALARPEVEWKCKAAEAFARAKRHGVQGLEVAVGPLRAVLDRPDEPAAVRLAVAQALVTLDAREAAPSLFRLVQADDCELRDLIEPALARWDYRPVRPVWRERLRREDTPPRSLVLAIRGLAAVHEGEAADRLRELVLSDHVSGPVRLEAARALAVLRTEALEPDAERLAADTGPRAAVPRLAAAALLEHHGSTRAVGLLQHLARDAEPAVAALAAARLLSLDSNLAVPVLPDLLASPDAKVRGLGVEVLRRQPSAEHVRLLSDRLDDAHPGVRVQARQALHELAGSRELHDRVIAEATRVLAAERWQGLEQAAILLTQLDHKPATGRLLELLNFNRSEVFIAAAWGLRRLAVPETLPDVLRYVEAATVKLQQKVAISEETNHQLSQLNQLLGEQKYGPAEPVLRKFVPRDSRPLGPEARAAAVWALGLIDAGKEDAALVAELVGRLEDDHSIPPEVLPVRRMAAITLGRLKAKEAFPTVQRYFGDGKPAPGPTSTTITKASRWAIEQITGKPVDMPKREPIVDRQWFLVPHE
jgi:HEAT repeat protein